MATIPSQNNISLIGRFNFRGNDRLFGMKQKDRRQHAYVVGQTGTGKTTLLENMALQDIRKGHGIAIIDPHGEFVERVLEKIPKERMQDVVYFNPVDRDFPIGFNVLEVSNQNYKHLVVSDLLGIFTKIWANVWSARMEYILQNCIMALLDTPGTTLLGIPRILVDKEYRQLIVKNIKDPVVRSFWIHEYETWQDKFRNEAIVPIQNKVNQFLNTSFIRNIVGQQKSSLNIPKIMDEGKILLVNVSKGKIGEDNSALLGAMIITKIQLASMERIRIQEEERRDFYLYVDEFQNFATESFASILSESRKYRLNIIIAHQYIGQLVTDISTKVRDAVFGNVGTMMTFRVGATDAEFMEKEFEPEFTIQDMINLPNHHIYLKLMVDGVRSRPFSAVTLPLMVFAGEESSKEEAIAHSRKLYATDREKVEKNINSWSGMATESEKPDTEGSVATTSGGTALFETVCANCGKTTQVPFKPDGKRPAYCLSCLRKIEDGSLIPLPERMPQVGAKTRFSSNLDTMGIEFKPVKKPTAPPPPIQKEERRLPQHVPQRFPEKEKILQHNTAPRKESEPSRPPRQEPSRAPVQNDRRHAPGILSRPIVRNEGAQKGVSLNTLTSSQSQNKGGTRNTRDEHPGQLRERKKTDLSELRKILEESLAFDKKPTASDHAKPPPPEKNKKISATKGVMKPGESLKL